MKFDVYKLDYKVTTGLKEPVQKEIKKVLDINETPTIGENFETCSYVQSTKALKE
tara:strand:- start:248 stop:412 length:165 start_codon:yes stop_codon:yes gene_type:complete